MSRTLTLVLLAALLAPTPGDAQASRILNQGERIRVQYRCRLARGRIVERCGTTVSPRTDTGQLGVVDRDTLRLVRGPNGRELTIPRDLVTKVWVVDGTKTRFWQGAVIGLVLGAALGGLTGGLKPGDDDDEHGTDFLNGGAALGAPAGFLIGGMIGSKSHSDRWRQLSDPNFRVGAMPRLHGAVVGMSVAF